MTATEMDPYKLVDVTSVEVLHDHVVRLGFSDGCVGEIDLGPKLRGPIFDPITADYDLFCKVSTDLEPGTIAWPNGADLAPEVLHFEAVDACPDPHTADEPIPTFTVDLDRPDLDLIQKLLGQELERLEAEGYDINRDWQAGEVASLIVDLVDQVADQPGDIATPNLAESLRATMDEAMASRDWYRKALAGDAATDG